MRQLLILLTVVGFAFAQQDVQKEMMQFDFASIKEKIEAAKAKYQDLIKQMESLNKEDKQAYFEQMREQAKEKMNAKLAGLSTEEKADIETKIAAIKDKFGKKHTKMKGFKKGKKCSKKELTEEQKAELKAQREKMKSKWKAKKGKKNDLSERDFKDFKKLFPFFGENEEKCQDPKGCVTPD